MSVNGIFYQILQWLYTSSWQNQHLVRHEKYFKIVSKLVLRLNISLSFSGIKTVFYLNAAAIFSDSVGPRLLTLLANLRGL